MEKLMENMKIAKNILLVLLLVFNVILIIKLEENEKPKSENLDSDQAIDYYKNCFQTALKHYGCHIKNDSVLDRKKNHVCLENQIEQGTLVVRISEFHCNACIEFLLVKLKRFLNAGKIDSKQMLILAHYGNPKLLTMLINKFDIQKIPVFLKRALAIPLEKHNMPYCFVLDKKMDIDCAFIPDKSVPYTIDRYLKSSDYTLLKKAGFTHVQTGIESFSSHYLKKMNKGTHVIDNLAALKYCKENRIKNSYNIITNYPNEEPVDFEESEQTIQLIQNYLEPPSISKFMLGFQSPIYNNLDDFNIDSIEPKLIDTIMYPEKILEKNFFFFYSFKRKKETDKYPWEDLVGQWNNIYHDQRRLGLQRDTHIDTLVFYFKDGKNFLKIFDKRFGEKALIYTLNHKERNVFLACTEVISFSELKSTFHQMNSSEIKEILKSFVESGIVYTEDDLFLSLPLNYHTYYDKKPEGRKDIEEIRAYISTL